MPNLLIALIKTAPLAYPQHTFKEALNRLKYIARGLLIPRETEAWIKLIQSEKAGLLARKDSFALSKLQRPYLHCRLSTAQKLTALQQHYRFATEHLEPFVFEQLAAESPYRLAQVALEESETISLILRAGAYTKEGEMAVSLRSENTGEWIYSLSFTVTCWNDHKREVLIGGLQGHDFQDEKGRTISITRGMKGMRPKAMVLFALQNLAQAWNLTSLRAVANGTHIYRSLQKRKTINADYDSFWIESGGELQGDGIFNLPMSPQVRDIADIKPNKRSMYRQRYALLDKLGQEIRDAVCSNRSGAHSLTG